MARREASSAWFDLGWQSWMLGIDASAVIALPMASVVCGGAEADYEIDLMFSEKIEAGHQLQAKPSSPGLGAAPATFNRRRLSHAPVRHPPRLHGS